MISAIICTYNRAELLNESLKTLVKQSLHETEYELIIVDNNCTDNTKEVVEGFQHSHKQVKYFLEEKVGLSHARNRGAREAKSNYLLFLDDDILSYTDTLEQALNTFKEKKWAAFGGIYTQWFYYGQPKWFPKNWNTNLADWNTYSELPNGKYATGCVFAIRKDKLNEVGSFDPNFGMVGNKIGYGEETDIQQKLRNAGYLIGFNPDIKIKHIVPKHKLKIAWHLRAAKKKKKSAMLISPNKVQYPFWLTIKRILFASVKRLSFLKKLINKNYYWQNFIFDYCEPIIRLCAAFHSIYFSKTKST